MEITNKDIAKAEKIFLREGQTFDEERKNFIKYIDKSLHLQACPGSGKTTTLLAKLFILSEKMPFENNRGICVLTHTNVAIDIVKDKLGEKANRLLSYPNFFGTIQSFVDKYLAIPAYIKYFGYRPNFIDTAYQKERMQKTYFLKGINQQTLKNLKSFNYSNDIFGNYTIVRENENLLIVRSNIKEKIEIKRPRAKNDWSDEEKQQILHAAIKLKEKVLYDGILSFDDAYDFANYYLEKFSELKNIFSSRFKFVFIDEAQDTSSIQKEIIEKCFNENVIIQWIGDVNQGIMNDNFSKSAWSPEANDRYIKMEFKNSHRISQPIANLIKGIALHPYKELNGNQNVNLKPIFIVFDDSSKTQVLNKFAEIIVNTTCCYNGENKSLFEISQITGNPIKAVGWVGKEKDKGLSIKSYFPDFDKQVTNIRRQHFPNLYTMYQLSKKLITKEFKNRTISCILEALYLSNINSDSGKKFSKTKFLEFIKEKDPNLFNQLMERICKYSYEDNFKDFSKEVKKILERLFNTKLNNSSINYLTEQCLKNVHTNTNNSFENIFATTINNNEIKIPIDTVHGIKGETHTATLYLETKYYHNSISYFIYELLLGKNNSNNGKIRKQALKIAHVAFSRPTHLLCIAIHRKQQDPSNISNNKDKFKVINLVKKIKRSLGE
ncbi:MAG: DNA helicase [Patescibacteria group bacterium]|nr:MAG: DNA helicase [Patescibacteria group bacterium]